MANITIHLNDDARDLKDLLKKIRKTDSINNPYFNRSESVAARMLLKLALEAELNRLSTTVDKEKSS